MDTHDMTTALAVIPHHPPMPWRGIIPADFETSLRMAKVIAASGMAPKSYYQGNADPVAAVWTAIQLGAEVGLSPMSSVQNIAVIGGRPGLFGPAMLAVVEASGKLASIEEEVVGEGDARAGRCTVQRIGRQPRTASFSVADAKRARLWNKTGPWTEYPDRMLLARARTFALRDTFPDVLLGLGASVEELQDLPAPADQPQPPARDVFGDGTRAGLPPASPDGPAATPAAAPCAPCKPSPADFWAKAETDKLLLAKATTSVETLITRLVKAIPTAPTRALLMQLFDDQPQALLSGCRISPRWKDVQAALDAKLDEFGIEPETEQEEEELDPDRPPF